MFLECEKISACDFEIFLNNTEYIVTILTELLQKAFTWIKSSGTIVTNLVAAFF